MADLYDHLDDAAAEDRERDALAAQVSAEDAWRAVLNTHQGRYVLASLLRQSGYLNPSHTPGDVVTTAYREGQRSMGAAVFGQVMALDAAGWPRMWRLLTGMEAT